MILENIASVIDVVREELAGAGKSVLVKMSTRKMAIECLMEEGIDRAVAQSVVAAIESGIETPAIIEGIQEENDDTPKQTPAGKRKQAERAKAGAKVAPKAKAAKAAPAKAKAGAKVEKTAKLPICERADDYQSHPMLRIAGKLFSESKVRLILHNREIIESFIGDDTETGDGIYLESVS